MKTELINISNDTMQQPDLLRIETDISNLLNSNKRKQQEKFNLLLKELRKTYNGFNGFFVRYFFNILKENNIEITKVLRIKIYRLIRNSNLLNEVTYNYDKPYKNYYGENHISISRKTIKSKLYNLI